jgi:hypothetical protein
LLELVWIVMNEIEELCDGFFCYLDHV